MRQDEDFLAESSRMGSFHIRLPSKARASIEDEAKRLTAKLGTRVTAGAVARVMLLRGLRNAAEEARKAATPQAAPQPITVRERKRA